MNQPATTAHEWKAYAYVVPFALYLVGTNIAGRFEGANYAYAYGVVSAVIAVVGWWLLRKSDSLAVPSQRSDEASADRLLFHARVGWGILAGFVGIALWIGLCHLHLEQYLTPFLPGFLQPGERVGFNPFEEFGSNGAAWAFIAVRLFGIAVVVPFAEEFFWRGFLLRWLIDPEWKPIPLGTYTLQSCALVTLMFTLAHPEWLAAATYCLLLNGLLYWKRDLWLCIVAHATSNLLLAIYVLATGVWWLW